MLEEILSTSSDFVNTENPKPYQLIKSLREPGEDDEPISSPLPSLAKLDLSFDPASFQSSKRAPRKQLELNYLDTNAQEGGGEQNQALRQVKTEGEILTEINGELARANICRKTAAHFEGSESQDLYHHLLNCRKPWCEICGGKAGVISKTRKKAVRRRVDVKKYGMMQLVFTVPMDIRPNLQSRSKINSLFNDAYQVTSKYFGDPEKTKRKPNGEIKEYSFGNELAIGYAHLFGDPDKKGRYSEGNAGTFHPHINVHVFKTEENLFVSKETLEQFKNDWKIRLLKYGFNPVDEKGEERKVDVHFLYVKLSAKERKKYHKIKYMVKPYLKENIDKVIEEGNTALLKLLTIGLKGFQFLRFWGGLSNVKKQYREDAGILPDDIDEIEERMQETLIFRGITDWNLGSFLKADDEREKEGKKRKFKKIAENFYREEMPKGWNDERIRH